MQAVLDIVHAWALLPETWLTASAILSGVILWSRFSRVTLDSNSDFGGSPIFSKRVPSALAGGDSDGDLAGPDGLLKRLEGSRGSKVFAFIHSYALNKRAETVPKGDWISDHELREFLSYFQTAPTTERLDIVLHSDGGDPTDVTRIARAIKAHEGETTVFVPYYAKGYTSLIVLAADNVVLGPNAVLSFMSDVDESLQQAASKKWLRNAKDSTLLQLHNYRNQKKELTRFICTVLHHGAHGESCRIGADLVAGKFSGAGSVDASKARKIGINLSAETMPTEVFELVQEAQVQYVPAIECPSRPAQVRNVCSDTCDLSVRPLVEQMERTRGSRVLCVVHDAYDTESKRVDELTAVEVLKALSKISEGTPLDIILHTPGGKALEGLQIARALKAHKGKKTVFVPFEAFSAGTIIALAADAIIMSPQANLGPIDLQIDYIPAAAWIYVEETKPRKKIDDDVLGIATSCRNKVKQGHANALELMKGAYPPHLADRIAHALNDGVLTHAYPIGFDEARKLGLKVSAAMPPEPMKIVGEILGSDARPCSVIFCNS